MRKLILLLLLSSCTSQKPCIRPLTYEYRLEHVRTGVVFATGVSCSEIYKVREVLYKPGDSDITMALYGSELACLKHDRFVPDKDMLDYAECLSR